MSEVIGRKFWKNSLTGLILISAYFLFAASNALATEECPVPFISEVVAIASDSHCELCGTGTVRVRLRNPTDEPLRNLSLDLNLNNPRLEYAGGLRVTGQPDTDFVSSAPADGDDNPSFTFKDLPGSVEDPIFRPQICSDNDVFDNDCEFVELEFNVRSRPGEEENLAELNLPLGITATARYSACGSATIQQQSDSQTLTIEQPTPSLSKSVRSFDTNSGALIPTFGDSTAYGHEHDGVVWEVTVNSGSRELEAVKFEDLLAPLNGASDLEWACFSRVDAISSVVDGSPQGSCQRIDDVGNQLVGIDAAGLKFNLPTINGTVSIFFSGEIDGSCNSQRQTNVVRSLEWGCDVPVGDPKGGITHAWGQAPPASQSAYLFSNQSPTDLDITTTIRNAQGTSGRAGSRGTITIRVDNNTGHTVSGIRLLNTLPAEYVMDPTYSPRVNRRNGGGGNDYPGRIDSGEDGVNWDNPVTLIPDQSNLGDTNLKAPKFSLKGDGQANGDGAQVDILRHGDWVEVTFGIILIDPEAFDLETNLDEGPSEPDTNYRKTLQHKVDVEFDNFCNINNAIVTETTNFDAWPEDLDVNIPAALHIVRDNGTTDLTFEITNEGGDRADHYYAYVSFGATMNVVGVPNGCSSTAVANPPLHPSTTHPSGANPGIPIWKLPPPDNNIPPIPADASVYLCSIDNGLGTLRAQSGSTGDITFIVEKNTSSTGLEADDLTFRVDLIGEITLDDERPLIYPTPEAVNPGTDPVKQQANNYSLDAMRGKVLGFNLLKRHVPGSCNELPNRPSIESEILIGEECDFEVYAGGWFGFETPGYNLIAVGGIEIADETPGGLNGRDGHQGYINHQQLSSCADATFPDPTRTDCSDTITSFTSTPGTLLSDSGLKWNVSDGSSYAVDKRGQWFLANMTTRLLNKDEDAVSGPTIHGDTSTDYGRARFTAYFKSGTGTSTTEQITIDNSSCSKNASCNTEYPGYPQWQDWTAELTVTEPNLNISKKVCNFSQVNGNINNCSWEDTVSGSKFDDFVYRITVENNQAAGPGAAPAYDVVITDELASAQMCVWPLATDGLQNTPEGDFGLVGTGVGRNDYSYDPNDPEASPHCLENGTRAYLTFSYDHSVALEQVNESDSIDFYYRVSPHRTVVPNQSFKNTASIFRYDSLKGLAGSQSNPTIGNTNHPDTNGQVPVRPASPALGGARIYCIDGSGYCGSDDATMTIIDVKTEPKEVIELSLGDPRNNDVVVGEEIRYRLTGKVPASRLIDFTFRDDLPDGLSCIEADALDLRSIPDTNWFTGGDPTVPQVNCTDDYVEWRYGNQHLLSFDRTTYPDGLVPVELTFIARVENNAFTPHATTLVNPKVTGVAQMTYRPAFGADPVATNFDPHTINVQGPNIQLTKSFAVPNSDADDILTVTVTAENTGTAAAYNLHVLDDLTGTKLVYLGNIGGTDPPQVVDVTTIGANAPIFSWNRSNTDYTIAVGETKTFTFDVRVEQGVEPHEILDNTIQSRWQSLPGNDIALNSSNSIGTDGADDGMRIGVLPNTGDPINDYETTASAQTEVPALQLVKTDLEPTVVPTIGAHKKFQLEIRLPEGISRDVVITDQLGSPEGYVLSHNADFDITYDFVGIETINGAAPSEGVFNSFPTDNTSGNAVWNIGTVDTASENDTAGSTLDPLVRITYFARVENDLATNNGDTRQNSAALTYSNGESGATENLNDNTAAVTVVEPLLTINKAVSNATNPGNLPVGGDVLEYVITVAHDPASTAAAFDLNLVDSLPSELQFDSSFTPTALINGGVVTGFVATPAAAPTGPLVWGRDNGDNTLDLQLGETLVITYRTQVTGVFGSPISNSVMLDWTSLDDSSINQLAYERDGDGCPAVSAPDDYCEGPAEASIDTVDNTGIVKTVVADSDTASVVGTLRVGDTVTYQLALNLQAGTTPAVTINDALPSGLEFNSIVSVNGDTAAPYDDNLNDFVYSAIAVPAAGDTGTVTWNLGDILSNFGNTNKFVIEYTAKVVAGSGIAAPTATLTNTAVLNYTGAVSTLQDSADITILQPVIDSLTKTDATWPSSHMNVDPANDVMQFTLHACNSGLAPAYDLSLTDDLATQMDQASIANLQVTLDGTLLTQGTEYTYTAPGNRGDDMQFTFLVPVEAGACLDINYEIGFYTDIGGGENWVNTFTVNEFWSLPAKSGEQYAPVPLGTPYPMGTVATTVTAPQKTLQSAATAAVGEEVVYRIQVPGSATTSAIYDVVITDVLDPSLELIQLQEINGRAFTDNTTNNNIALTLDIIPAGAVAIFELRARVANNATAQAGHNFNNEASYSYAATSGGVIQAGGTGTAPTLTIVEPDLSATNSVANQTNPGNDPDAGDILRFTLDLTAAGNPENAAAYDLLVREQLSLGLAFVPGSVIFAGVAQADPTVSGDGINAAQLLEWNRVNSDLDIAAGTNSLLVFDVLVLDEVLAEASLSASARIEWTSLDEDNSSPYERNGADGIGGLNDYVLENIAAQLTAANDSTISKTRVDDSYGSADAQLRVGDLVEYELRLSLPEGTAPNTLIVDTLPQGMVFVGTQSINGVTTAPFASAAPFAHNDIAEPVQAGDPATGPTTLSWNIAQLINSGDNNLTNDEFILRYQARVLNKDVHPWPASNTALTNNVEFTFDAAAGAELRNDSDTLDLLQPDLIAAISATPAGGTTLSAGDIVDYTITITNNGSAPAYDPVFRDMIPIGLRQGGVNVQSITVNGAAATIVAPTFDNATGAAVWDFSAGTVYAINPGQALEMVYRVQADANLGAGLNLQNAAYVELYYSLDDDNLPSLGATAVTTDMREDYGPTAPVSVQFNTPNAAPLLIENTQPASSIGEPFNYRITIPETVQPTALHDVSVLMDLSTSAADLEFVGAAKVSGSNVFTPENSGSGTALVIADATSGIDVPAGEQVVIDVTLRLRDSNPPNVDGLAFNNSASYSYNYDNDNAAAGQGAGAGNTTLDMQVVEPTAITLTKTGPASVQSGLPGTFTLDLHNVGTGPAWDITVTDILPDKDPGGMCETPPNNFAAQIIDGAGTAVATLVAGTDFNTVFDEASCTLTITSMGAAAMLAADHHLLLSYDATLDVDTIDGDTLTNIAGVELWHSWDSGLPEARQYTRPAPTDGTPGVLDHEDAYTVSASVPKVTFYKTVENVTRAENPATLATPADVLRYTLTLTNLSGADVSGIEITDDLGRLNSLPLFQSGSLQLVTAPMGSDSSNSDASAGTHGSGFLQVKNLDLAATGNTGDSVQLVYEVTLAAVIDSGTPVLNQAQVQLPGQLLKNSDDPNINGTDDPDVADDEDPTQILIESEPLLVIHKTSADITGDPDLLMVADTLRYTIRVENAGNENIVNAMLRDQIPANTTYVAGSTTLNGSALSDVSGASPLEAGMSIHTPGQADGFIGATATATGAVASVITFDVTINDVNDGTIISNQGFVNGEGAGSGPFDEAPSDDPATDAPNDPTIDIVGDVPLLIAHKTVAIAVDNISMGIVDPGDVLRYTIAISNMGGVDALQVALTDQVPANTTYVAGSTTLNGMAVADNAGGMSLLNTELPVASDDLTPPLPGANEGVITSAQTATVTFDVMVNVDAARGTVISNQGSVTAEELPLVLTDADGNPANGAQPTLVVVGDAQLLSIVKEVAVVGGGAAEAGVVLEYLVTIENISGVPATMVSITDDLMVAGDGVLTYVTDSAMLNGQVDGVSIAGTVITADYSAIYGDLLPGESAVLRFQAKLSDNLEIGYTVLNTAEVHWNDPPSTNQASVALDVGGTPGIANLAGYLWHDVNFNNQVDMDERLLLNWAVDLYFNDALLETIQTDENGYFQFQGLVPNSYGGLSYEMRYTAPDAGEKTASLGNPVSDFTNGPQRISEIFVESGANPQDLNLPLTPNGVIYNSILRAPITGATLTMLRASSGQELPDRCFDDKKQQGQVTRAGGYYKFDINFDDAACPANADYLIKVEIADEDYVGSESLVIPAQTNEETAGFDVGACLGSNADMIPGTAQHCEVQLSPALPPLDIEARDTATDYYLRLTLDDDQVPGDSQLFNNHIAMDPHLEGALSITKTAAMLNVTRSQLVPYTITFGNTLPIPLSDLQLVDFFPAGFKYVAGSARMDGEPVEPVMNGLQLIWSDLRVEAEQTRELKLLLVVGSGVGEGKYVNRARMFNQLSGQVASGEASATVRVVPDPTFDCTDVIGKVFDDKNMNGYQDAGEGGLPGARVVTATGLNATADAHGRFHITCAVVPNADRGSNFVLKLDDRSLPSGYRLTTENPRVMRATRGKMVKFNFGASLHRVVRLDMAEAVFEPGSTELRPQWQSRIELLLEKLSEAPSVLRLSYLAENEDPDLVEERLQTIKAEIADEWARSNGDYDLNIETEVFWRRGAPPSKGGLE
ncbi:isopeptide-forming domain-containing fimbrial protein [Microbulbifer variabilis]|uniref:isopeptide-forming domain-containing fimbrial protein n=1 Tax=Microbulbifer variabilis TaxID=266805 RepID=UPI00035EB032|nr:isopeptide-forming domain-containing fimbrial protein [Microbulbifer variabilis]